MAVKVQSLFSCELGQYLKGLKNFLNSLGGHFDNFGLQQEIIMTCDLYIYIYIYYYIYIYIYSTNIYSSEVARLHFLLIMEYSECTINE